MSMDCSGYFKITKRTPTVPEYQRLREMAGCDAVEDRAVETALGRSLFAVCAIQDEEVIAYARVVGDGGLYFFIQDIMVDPEAEGSGIEECLMSEIMDFLKEAAPPGAFFCVKGCIFQREECRQFSFKLSDDEQRSPFA